MGKRAAATLITAFLGWGAINPSLGSDGTTPAEGHTFAEALRAAGWGVEVLADGSLQLSPSTGAPSEPARAAPPSTGTAQGETAAEAGGWSVLRDHGWTIEKDAQGTTLLYPPRAVTAPSAPAPGPAQPTTQTDVAQDLDAVLAERGWRVERAADGSLSLFPLRRDQPARSSTEPSVGSLPPAVADGAVRLPVDTWDKARAVALSWLESVGDPSLRLGKIWRIQRIYLVSIVRADWSRALRHQISVGVDDGRVVVLN